MKQRLLIFGWVLVTMILLLLPSEHVKINAKIKNYEKPLRQECLVKDIYFYEEWMVIQKGKYYAFQDVLRVYGSKYKSAKELLNQIKNNRNVVCFGEGLKIKKNKFMAKKPGEYKLKIKTEDEYHVFTLRVAEPFCQMRLDGVVKIVISQRTMGKTTSMEITDPDKVNGITSKLTQTKYVLNCTKTLRKRVGCFWGYDVALYDLRDHLVDYFSMTSNTLCNSVAEWRSDSHFAKECFEFVDKTYKDALAFIPERLW